MTQSQTESIHFPRLRPRPAAPHALCAKRLREHDWGKGDILVGYEVIESNLAKFDEIISNLSLNLAADSPIAKDFDTTREFLSDRRTLEESVWLPKWDPRFKEFYHAQIVVHRLTNAVVILRGQQKLRSRLKQVLGGSLTQNFEPEAAKDYFYELEMAALWKECGFTVELEEPDVVVSGNGLLAPLGVACKYPSGLGSLHEHISKGYKQITRHAYEGLVAIGLDQLVFKGMSNFMDFRKSEKPPLEVMKRATSEAMTNLVALREQNYPCEQPIDGAMITLSAAGIYGTPAGLTRCRHVTLQCDDNNPRKADFEVLHKGMESLASS
jgi:hypothetical protein